MSLITRWKEWKDEELSDRWFGILCGAIGATTMLAALIWLNLILDWFSNIPNPILDAA